MNYLRRELAPIGQAAWGEIEDQAKRTLQARLSGRRLVDFDGPHGPGLGSVTTGRLSVPKGQDDSPIHFGVHQVLPLVEARVPFKLSIWELDNAERGAKDLDLDPVIEACRALAHFENEAIFAGFPASGISGLLQEEHYPKIAMSLKPESIIDAISKGRALMTEHGVSGPANLAAPTALWNCLAHNVPGGILRTIIERQIGGEIIFSPDLESPILMSARGGDAALTVGQDIAIGYHSHDTKEVSLYLVETFTFQVTGSEAVLSFQLK